MIVKVRVGVTEEVRSEWSCKGELRVCWREKWLIGEMGVSRSA